jgi:hypothetical protein
VTGYTGLAEAKIQFVRHILGCTGSEAHPSSYPMGTGGSFPLGKAVGV